MENPTPFSLNEVIHRWRAEFGSPSSLNAAELEELEAHLRDHVAQQEAAGMKSEAAFAVAAKQLGDRQRVAGEFAKINPQRVWLERGLWMLIGIMFCGIIQSMSLLPGNLARHLGLLASWPAPIAETVARLAQLSVLAMGAMLGWWILTQRTHWGVGALRFCSRQPQAACVGLWLAVYVAGVPLDRLASHILSQLPPLAEADWHGLEQVQIWGNVIGEFIQNALLAVGVSLLAVWVMRRNRNARLEQSRPGEQQAIRFQATERALWMTAGTVFQKLVVGVCFQFALLPAALLNSSISNSLVAQHLVGCMFFVLIIAPVVSVVWCVWQLEIRRSGFGVRFGRTIRNHPWAFAVALATILSFNSTFCLVLLWAGTPRWSLGISGVVMMWLSVAWMVFQVAQVLLLVMLVIWRLKLHEAGSSEKDSLAAMR